MHKIPFSYFLIPIPSLHRKLKLTQLRLRAAEHLEFLARRPIAGGSYARQRRVFAETGDLTTVVAALVAELETTPNSSLRSIYHPVTKTTILPTETRGLRQNGDVNP
jgi:hypothetical protein